MKYTEEQVELGTAAVRDYINSAGYGSYVSNDICRDIAIAVLEVV